MTTPVSGETAFILHKRPYRETSLLLELFSADNGRLGAVWRGGRRSKQGGPGLFVPLHVSWSGRGDLKTLLHAEASAASAPPQGRNLYAAMYLNELLYRLLPPHEAQSELFRSYTALLDVLRLADAAVVEAALRRFELHLLDVLGYGLDFTHEAENGEAIMAGSSYRFDPGRGFLLLGKDTAQQKPNSFSGKDIVAAATGDWSARSTRKCLLGVTRVAIDFHLHGKPMQSREVFRRLELQQ